MGSEYTQIDDTFLLPNRLTASDKSSKTTLCQQIVRINMQPTRTA